MEITPIKYDEEDLNTVLKSSGSLDNMIVANIFFGFPGLVLLIVALFITPARFKYFTHGVKANLEKEAGFGGYYHTYGGKEYWWYISSNEYDADSYQLYFMPDNPGFLRRQNDLVFLPLFLFAMGGTFFGIGFAYTRGHYYQMKQNRELWERRPWVLIKSENIQEEEGTITEIIEEKIQDAKSLLPKNWYILCECANSVTGEKLLLKSEKFWVEPYKYFKIGEKIDVILDKTNKNKYIVDVNSVFERNAENLKQEEGEE